MVNSFHLPQFVHSGIGIPISAIFDRRSNQHLIGGLASNLIEIYGSICYSLENDQEFHRTSYPFDVPAYEGHKSKLVANLHTSSRYLPSDIMTMLSHFPAKRLRNYPPGQPSAAHISGRGGMPCPSAVWTICTKCTISNTASPVAA
jgi:hypothetical protein